MVKNGEKWVLEEEEEGEIGFLRNRAVKAPDPFAGAEGGPRPRSLKKRSGPLFSWIGP